MTPFGSPVVPELGFPIGTRGQICWLEEGQPSSLAPAALASGAEPWRRQAQATPTAHSQRRLFWQPAYSSREFSVVIQKKPGRPRTDGPRGSHFDTFNCQTLQIGGRVRRVEYLAVKELLNAARG
jgi:hypothetical protein